MIIVVLTLAVILLLTLSLISSLGSAARRR